MRTSLIALLLGASAVAVGVACGGGGGQDAFIWSEYATSMETVHTETAEEYSVFLKDLADATAGIEPGSAEETLERDRQRYEGIVALHLSLAEQVRGVDAPSDATEAHAAYAAALKSYGESAAQFLTTEAYERSVLDRPQVTEEHTTGVRDYVADVAAFYEELEDQYPNEFEQLNAPQEDMNAACDELLALATEGSSNTKLCLSR